MTKTTHYIKHVLTQIDLSSASGANEKKIDFNKNAHTENLYVCTINYVHVIMTLFVFRSAVQSNSLSK